LKKLRIYIDTSVIGGCFDDPFKDDSLRLFDEIKSDKKIAIISEVFLRELQDAPVFEKNSMMKSAKFVKLYYLMMK
jgi:predicted nucleic acid-binding protein